MQTIVTGRAGDAHAQFELLEGSSHESVSNSKRASRSHAKTGLFPGSLWTHFWTHSTEGRRMTGSAQTGSEAVRFRLLLGEKKKGRVWEGKGLGVGVYRRGGG